MGHGRHLEDGPAERLQIRTRNLSEIATIRNVDLVENDDARTLHDRHVALHLRQVTVVRLQLGLDNAQILDGLAISLKSSGVQDMHDDRAALNVAQKVQAKASSLRRTGNQAGNVSDRVTRVASRHDAQVRDQRRERIIRDLRTRRTHRSDQ